MKCYKLTEQNGMSYNNTQWGEGIRHESGGSGEDLCSSSWIHFYTDPLVAVLVNPIYANFKNPILWEAESDGEELHTPLKSSAKGLRTIKRIEIPSITKTQKVAFTILCAKVAYKESSWNIWADNWLKGKNRGSVAAANASAYAAYVYAARTTTTTTAAAAANANAAYGAYGAAAAASAYAAYGAAYAYAYAVANAANASFTINLPELAKEALSY